MRRNILLSHALVALCLACSASLASAQAPAPGATPPRPHPATARKAAATAAEPAGFAAAAKQASTAREANDLDKAVTHYKRALALKPEWTEGWWALGTACYDLDRYDEANDAFRRVLAKDDSDGVTWVFKGLTSFKLKRYDDALSELTQARRRGVTSSREISEAARYHTALLLIRNEDYEQALAVLSDFGLEGNDSPRIIEVLGLATLRMPMLPDDLPGSKRELVMLAGRAQYFTAARLLQASQNAFDALVSRYPDTPNVHYAYGVMLSGEQPEQAIERFKRELAVSPTHVLAKIQIAFAYIKRSEFAEAKPWAEQAVQEAPTMFVAHNALGQVLLATGDLVGAVRALEAAVKLAPDSPAMHFALARAYRAAQRPADADREQAEFTRLDRLVRQQRTGENSVGGMAPPR
ncbi:MAG: tetratricopeptide repeat protein [Vicinamibacteraceae bacterium]